MAKLNAVTIREYLIKNYGFKPFTKVHSSHYAGAEDFEDGSSPIIKEESEFNVIYDGNGFSFESESESLSFNAEEL